ncbi:Cupredoxin [Kockiozyma suomiensis]|uniref:Cupredoxin n=1 Tax=Kockiozyma suomiensis TaxID=1337062 RepID=UPI003343F483
MGIGLRKYQNSSNPSSSSTSSSLNEDWRLDTSTAYAVAADWDSSAEPTTRVYNLTISETTGWPDGYNRTLTVINGQFPGPLIEVNAGDRLIVNVINNGVNATTMHFHGLFQNGSNYMDGVTGITQCPIPAGSSFQYNFTISDSQYGTYWYHSHYGTQYSDGVYGPLVIHSADEDEMIGDMYDYDQVVLIQDWYHGVSFGYLPEYLASNNENTEPTPDNGLINGANFFNCSLKPDDTCYQAESKRELFNFERDKTYRLRVINVGSFAEIDFSVDSHPFTLVEADGTTVKPSTFHKVRIAVAQRYSVLMTTNVTASDSQNDTYWMRAELNKFCFKESNPVLDVGVKAAIKYTNTTDSVARLTMVSKSSRVSTTTNSWDDRDANVRCLDLDNNSIEPFEKLEVPNATHFFRLDSSFFIGAYQLDLAYINGTSWVSADTPTLYSAWEQLSPAGLGANSSDSNATSLLNTVGPLELGVYAGNKNQYVINVPDYAVVDILLNNLDDGSHPFHLHGYKFWVMDSGRGNYKYTNYGNWTSDNPMLRDTVTVQSYGWAILRFVADNPGLWAFHCHITWHLEAGLMMQFQTMSSQIGTLNPPSEWQQLCAA